ncbi:MAG: 3-hydroxyacyl-CoA dehydrogenase NAD-binding domain-containing protein [Pseudomonadota bacterium]
MCYKNIKVEIDDDGIALVVMDIPGKSMNVLDADLLSDLRLFADKFATDDNIRGAVIASGKPSGFLAGADLKGFSSLKDASRKEIFTSVMEINQLYRAFETSGYTSKELVNSEKFAKPIATAITGHALGGGLELALATHYRVCSDNQQIKLGLPEVQIGLIPGGGGTQRLPRITGLQTAAMMMTEGRPISPDKAKEYGFIDHVAPEGAVIDAAKEWVRNTPHATQPWDRKGFRYPGGGGAMDPRAIQFFMPAIALTRHHTKGNYPAAQAIMSCLYEGSILDFDTALKIEAKYFTKIFTNIVSKNMIRTLFTSREAAQKDRVRPVGVQSKVVSRVGVLGAGMMGAGIAYVTAKAGVDVVLLDRDIATAVRGKTYSEKIVEKAVGRGILRQSKADALLERITPTTEYSDLSDVDLIIEAVFENTQIKADVTRRAEDVTADNVVFASNTSTLPISELAKASVRPEKFIGIHFFSPVDKMPLIEIICGEKTDDKTKTMALDYAAMIGKIPIIAKDVRGFYTNRCVPSYLNEAMLMVKEGVSPTLLENAALGIGMPVAPLALLDEMSLSLIDQVNETTKSDLGDDYEPSEAEDVVACMVRLGRLGRKSKAGFYDYLEEGRKRLWSEINKYFPLAEKQPSLADVEGRLLYAQLVPAAVCLDEGVVLDPQSADLGAVFGWGFPSWMGGPMSYVDMIGVEAFVKKADEFADAYGPRFAPPISFRERAASSTPVYTCS